MALQEEELAAAQALSLQWVYGLSHVPANAVNLSDHGQHGGSVVAYAAAHTAVIYSQRSGKQTFLQGHCNAISALLAPPDRSFLVTADAGTEASLLVFWDPASGQPLHTVRQQPHAGGVLALAISHDGSCLATLSAALASGDGAHAQEVSLWDISGVASSSSSSAGEGPLQPMCTAGVPAGDTQARISFNPGDACELISNGRQRTLFWQLHRPPTRGPDSGSSSSSSACELGCHAPQLRQQDFQQSVGDCVASAFVPNRTQALTSTVEGDIIVWAREAEGDDTGAWQTQQQGSAAAQPAARRALKVIRLHGAAITHLSSIGEFVVTGGADGLVRLFDAGLRLCAWYEDLAAGPITCVSFAGTRGQPSGPAACMQMSRLCAPDFVVSTAGNAGKVLAVSADSFNTPDPCNPSGAQLLVQAPHSALTDVLAHPLRPELLLLATPSTEGGEEGATPAASSSSSGQAAGRPAQTLQVVQQPQQLMRWDLVGQACLASRALPPEQHVLCMALARDGSFVAGGCAGGHVVLLRGDSLQEVVALRHTRHDIARLSVSLDGRFVAAADGSGQVLLYGHVPHKAGAFLKVDLVGKFRAHHKAVVGLAFGEAPGGQTRLFSCGADHRLIEYDLSSCSTANAGLRTRSIRDCVAPGAAGSPTALCFAPPMPYFSHASTDTLLLVADDAFKIKAFNPDSPHACASATCLGPTFGGALNKLVPFRSVTDAGATPWLAYSTAERLVGLMSWPLDSECSMGLIAHPGRIRQVVLTHDGRQLITLGTGGVMNCWAVNTSALAPQDASSGKADWGRLIGDAELVEELRDTFCYAQLTTQPLDTTGGFDIDGRVPAAALADLMRAAGFYPSDADIEGLQAHVRFLADMAPEDDAELCGGDQLGATAGQAQDGKAAASGTAAVALDTFLQLYVSHRPVVELGQQEIQAAFATLAPSTRGVLDVDQLLELLTTGGEPMSAEELQQVLHVLTGHEDALEALPDCIDAHAFQEILGFEG